MKQANYLYLFNYLNINLKICRSITELAPVGKFR